MSDTTSSHTRMLLNKGWAFSQVSSGFISGVQESWEPCKVPTSVHVDLQRVGRIPDAFKDLNEWKVQWVQEADWTFKMTFAVDASQLDKDASDLYFEGLDTYCTIMLNGVELAVTSNMFHSHRVPCKKVLKAAGNELELRFASPWHAARTAEEQNGGPMHLWNGASNRLYSRKAQYGWGWDWGPVIMTVGPWRDIHLDCYNVRLSGIRIESTLSGPRYDDVSLTVQIKHSGISDNDFRVDYTLKGKDGKEIKIQQGVPASQTLEWNLKEMVEAWYPIGYGQQPLYTLEVHLKDSNGRTLDSSMKRVAFRSARIVQEPLEGQEGSSFVFEINGIRLFCGGSNWIPAGPLGFSLGSADLVMAKSEIAAVNTG